VLDRATVGFAMSRELAATSLASPPAPPRRSEVRRWSLPVLSQVSHRRPGQEWIPHWHEEWSIGAIVAGECLCSVGGTPLRARAGDVLAIAPRTVHAGALVAAEGADHVAAIMLYVDTDWLTAQGGQLPAGSGFLHLPALADRAAGLTTLDAASDWLRETLPALCAGLAERAETRALIRAPTSAAQDMLLALQAAVDEGPLTVAHLADQCRVSRERLHRVIRRWTGMSPSAYLRALRLSKAREQLCAGAPLAEIAQACGFADQAHFTRSFRQSFGYTPGDWLSALR
jgi:AraC-like DNA-binding protein